MGNEGYITNGTLSVVENELYKEIRGGGGTSLMERHACSVVENEMKEGGHITNETLSVVENEGYDERRGHITNGALSVVENEGHDERRVGGGGGGWGT